MHLLSILAESTTQRKLKSNESVYTVSLISAKFNCCFKVEFWRSINL